MALEIISYNGVKYAEIIWADTVVEKTRFFSPAESSFQFGIVAHAAGYQEEPHYHKAVPRTITDLQQVLVIQKGAVAVQLYKDDGELLREIVLRKGDAIVLIHGPHAIRVVEDVQCISVKQGPFYGDEEDKILIKSGKN